MFHTVFPFLPFAENESQVEDAGLVWGVSGHGSGVNRLSFLLMYAHSPRDRPTGDMAVGRRLPPDTHHLQGNRLRYG